MWSFSTSPLDSPNSEEEEKDQTSWQKADNSIQARLKIITGSCRLLCDNPGQVTYFRKEAFRTNHACY